ncbi:MAG: aminopeptidase, partial [Bacteroidota bacterium]
MFKNFFFFIFLILISLVVSHLDLINYGLGQAKGQLNIVQKAVPIEELLIDLSFEDSLKQKIRIINKVRQYAIDSIGLQNSTNYT